MARLRRELGELEAIVEEQARPADRSACLEALAERRESHDSIRQILRDATLRAADAEANAATSAPSEGDERDELLGLRQGGERGRWGIPICGCSCVRKPSSQRKEPG